MHNSIYLLSQVMETRKIMNAKAGQWPQATWCNSWWFVKTEEMARAVN